MKILSRYFVEVCSGLVTVTLIELLYQEKGSHGKTHIHVCMSAEVGSYKEQKVC